MTPAVHSDNLVSILSDSRLLGIWLILALLSCAWLLIDLLRNNQHIVPIMKAAWILTVLYSGPLGLLIYFYAGRKEIRTNSLWRKGFRSVVHCYSGCGAGEIVGVSIAVGLFALGNLGISVISFLLAYVFGFGMTFGPLLQQGVQIKKAFIDTVYSDTATITAMEITAISLDTSLAGTASINQTLFWNSLILSLFAGLLVAYPVNLLLIKYGIKSGMGDPRDVSR